MAAQSLAAQTIAPHWEGAMIQQGSPLSISLDFVSTTSGLTATWSAPGMRALRIPLQQVTRTGDQIHFELVGDQSSTVFDAELRGDTMVGAFRGGEGNGALLVTRRPVAAAAYREEAVTFSNGPATLVEGESVKSADWYQWLGIPPKDNWLWGFYPPIGNFDALSVWKRVTVPTLLIYGQNDQLIPVDSSLRKIGRALDQAGNTRWAAVILPRAAHNFTISPAPGEPFEWRKVAPGLPEIVLGWVREQS